MAIDTRIEKLVQELDVSLEANALAYLAKMFFPNLLLELRIMQQQVGEFSPLLHQVDLRHSLRLALELFRRNADEFREHVAGIVEGERLVEVAREDVAFERIICHTYSIRVRLQRPIKRIDWDYMPGWLTYCE